MEHSDSDSGESWTLLDHTPAHADEVPNFPDISSVASKGELGRTNYEKDEDTDGISIISDSDPESPILNEIDCNDLSDMDGDLPCISIKSAYIEDTVIQESVNDNEFLGNNNSKHKTYVHKRNKRLSTLLNIIVLGSVITAAGVAIGHMWGAKNDCLVNKMPSVNKILSNLYKLQEENAYLRSKLKEFELNQVRIDRRKSGTKTNSYSQNKCKKVFEDSINNRNSEKPIKCVDNKENIKTDYLIKLKQENQNLKEINKFKEFYNQNRTLLNYESDEQLKAKENYIGSAEMNLRFKSIQLEKNNQKHANGDEILTKNTNSQVIGLPILLPTDKLTTINLQQRKISYADSLKTDEKVNDIPSTNLDITTDKDAVKAINNDIKGSNMNSDVTTGYLSEEDLKKDSRYVEKKHKNERKRDDRQKLYKKQKRKNKYEQWELKGGYLKDYDDVSISSTQESEFVLKIPHIGVERHSYIVQDNKSDLKSSGLKDIKNKIHRKTKNDKKNGNKEKDSTWFEKRAVFRSQARKKLEQELFGESSANNAGWYFRRMHRREQCRDKEGNSTNRKLSKRDMNFKMKY